MDLGTDVLETFNCNLYRLQPKRGRSTFAEAEMIHSIEFARIDFDISMLNILLFK